MWAEVANGWPEFNEIVYTSWQRWLSNKCKHTDHNNRITHEQHKCRQQCAQTGIQTISFSLFSFSLSHCGWNGSPTMQNEPIWVHACVIHFFFSWIAKSIEVNKRRRRMCGRGGKGEVRKKARKIKWRHLLHTIHHIPHMYALDGAREFFASRRKRESLLWFVYTQNRRPCECDSLLFASSSSSSFVSVLLLS